jgi:hypothetical protein
VRDSSGKAEDGGEQSVASLNNVSYRIMILRRHR